MRTLVFIAALISPKNLEAQPIEDQLVYCIEESQKIINYSYAWREANLNSGLPVKPREIAEVYTSLEKGYLLDEYILGLFNNDLTTKDKEDLNSAYQNLDLKITLITNMIEEAFEDRTKASRIAEFVAQCSSNYGGETYSLKFEIEELQDELELVRKALETTKIKEKANIRDALMPYQRRVDQLCKILASNELNDEMSSEVYLYGKYYKLCD